LKAVIMAGGAGSRLRPLTCGRPKPMTPVMNKPVMEYAVELLKRYGITDIGVTLQYLPEEIKRYFGDGSCWGVNLEYFVEETPLGTAGSVKNAEEFLDESFIVISGDALTDFDLSRAVEFHFDSKAAATLVLTTVGIPLEYGVVITDKKGKIIRFLEKPAWGEVFSDQVNTGIYILQPEVLELIPAGTMYDFSKNLFPKLLVMNEPLYGCVLEGYWCDIGNIQQYRQAHYDMLAGKVNLDLPGKIIGDDIRAGNGVEISSAADIQGPVLLGDNCFVGPGARIEPFTVIGSNAVVEEGASIKRTIIWEKAYIGRNAALRGAVICKGARVDHNVSIYEGAVIGDDSEVKEFCTVKPDVKIWPYKVIEKGATVYTSLVWGNKGIRSLFGRHGVPGILNLDVTPEFAAKLGGAYGGSLAKNDTVVISSDGQPSTDMIKTAFISGLLSTGVNVYNGGALPTPLNRYAVRSLGVKGGVHLRTDLKDGDKLWFQFMDHRGVNIDRDAERKIENSFFREDFRRVKGNGIGHLMNAPHIIDSYVDNLTGSVNSALIREALPKVVVYAGSGLVNEILTPVLQRVGCFAVYYEGNEQQDLPGNYWDREDFYRDMAEKVSAEKADFGAIIDRHAEQLILVDGKGMVVTDDLYTVLIALIIFRANEKGRIAVPVTAPSIIEQVAEQYNGQVIRTKTSPCALMDKVLEGEEFSGKDGYSQFFLQYDSLYALVKILEFLVKQSITLTELVASIPSYHLNVKTTFCPWEAKGNVMRRLIDEEQGKSIELLDGIKIYSEDGWALVLPDAEEPSYNVYSEAFSQETAESLTDLYLDKVNRIIRENTRNK